MPRTADTTHKLLPSSSTKLERDLLSITPFDAPLHGFAPKITSAKLTDLPDSWLPWLVTEYGLGELAEFFDDPRELIEQGLLLRTLRGTAAGAELAMGWLGFPDAQVWEQPERGLHFAEWEIDLGAVPRDLELLCKIARLGKIVQPSRARLRRVFSGYNIRQFILDESDWGALLSHYSGVWVDGIHTCGKPTGLWASFSGQFGLWVQHDLSLPVTDDDGLPVLGDDGEPEMMEVGGYDVRSRYERLNDYGMWIHPPTWPVLDDDYQDSFYPIIGIVGLGGDRESSGGGYVLRPRWQALSPPSLSLRHTNSVRVGHVSDVPP